jgi:hypothetical protein
MRTAFMVMALCLSSCASNPVLIAKLPSYGDPGPGTIHVLVRSGFERPGHYYLSKGTTLGLLIDVAGWRPVRAEVSGIYLCKDVVLFHGDETRFLVVEHDRGRHYKTDQYISHLDKKGMPYQHRERVLLDGDKLCLSSISF